MMTPIRTMTISEIAERKNDVIVSADDIKKIAKQEHNRTIDEFVKQFKKKYPLSEDIFTMNEVFHHRIDEIAMKMKEGVNNA